MIGTQYDISTLDQNHHHSSTVGRAFKLLGDNCGLSLGLVQIDT